MLRRTRFVRRPKPRYERRSYSSKDHFDLIVIGGGSGGLAASKEAAKFGKKVAVCDFVTPTHRGTKWGLGGTCVNVGCIPKKLMHHAALLKEGMHDAPSFGWQINPETAKLDWGALVEGVQNHIKSLNWGYKGQLREKGVMYLNEFASFVDKNTVLTKSPKGVETIRTADNFLIAVGGRPDFPEIPGIEHTISSDDVFSLKNPPGKTLVVGASYVALECAGFLNKFGFDTTVMVRSILLRGFDRQMVDLIHQHMLFEGVKFIQPTIPQSITKDENGKLHVTYTLNNTVHTEVYDTVLIATGRKAVTHPLRLESIGINLGDKNKIPVNELEQTVIPNIFAIGDCAVGRPELTPTAIQAGKLLARRLYGSKYKNTINNYNNNNNNNIIKKKNPFIMDYDNVATTVFTPLEYGSVGLSEEVAIERFGKDNIEVYHAFFQPLEHTVPHRPENQCYAKIICHKHNNNNINNNNQEELQIIEDLEGGDTENEIVVGIHLCGPNAGEVIQGYAVAVKMGATKADIDLTVGIHPTVAEEITGLNITKRSGADPKKTGC